VTAPVRTPLRYQPIADALQDTFADPQPLFFPGPNSNQEAADQPVTTVTLTLGGGPGLTTDSLMDRVALLVDVAGEQNDYDSAEQTALDLDKAIMDLAETVVGGVRIAGVMRSARPQLSGVDDGDRWHLGGSYVLLAESGLL
jgi:hypothetical protein